MNMIRYCLLQLTSIICTKLKGKAQTVVVVPVVRIVVVTIRHSAVPCVVVPATATENTVRALIASYHFKISHRKPLV